ncbi:MAG: hypothetical protein NE327_22540, partial [Lentisphaeraceae bacterium]|nr:hypothetical protein [Lentisphaeraceae bacterium]
MFLRFLLVIFTINFAHAQVTDLEEISNNNPFNLSEAEFKNKYVEKYKINWRGGFSGASKDNVKIYGFIVDSVHFKFSKNKLSSIKLDLVDTLTKMGFKYWANKNYEVLKQLTAKYGKPKKNQIKEDLCITANWETPGFDIFLQTKAVDSPLVYSAKCSITFYKNKTFQASSKTNYNIPGDVLESTKSYLYNIFQQNLPSKNEISAISNTLAKLNVPKVIISPKHKVFYGHSNKYREPEIDPLKLFYCQPISRMGTKDQLPFKSGFVEIITENSKIIALHNISVSNQDKKENVMVRTSYIYDKDKALKIIYSEYNSNKLVFWLEYNENGFVSRAYEYLNGLLKNVYFIHTNDAYKTYATLQYSYIYQKFMDFRIKYSTNSIDYKFNTYSREFQFMMDHGNQATI